MLGVIATIGVAVQIGKWLDLRNAKHFAKLTEERKKDFT
tara:strand:+ start:535 stop:651 length:117 start_codon:yes stop_codon:yes gene_type:complete